MFRISANPMFSKKSRRLQRQASFSGIANKLMDAKSEKSRKLSRQINKMAKAQEEQELQQMREQEEAAQEEKKKKEEGFARSVITRKLSVFGSYRRMSFSCKPIIADEFYIINRKYKILGTSASNVVVATPETRLDKDLDVIDLSEHAS